MPQYLYVQPSWSVADDGIQYILITYDLINTCEFGDTSPRWHFFLNPFMSFAEYYSMWDSSI